MNEELKKFLFSLNCTVINPVKKSMSDNTVVGWYCKSTSVLKFQQHYEQIEKFIEENKIDYYLSEGNETTAKFFIYINKTNG